MIIVEKLDKHIILVNNKEVHWNENHIVPQEYLTTREMVAARDFIQAIKRNMKVKRTVR